MVPDVVPDHGIDRDIPEIFQQFQLLRRRNLRHPLGGGADRDRGRRRGLSPLSRQKNARERIVSAPELIAASPDIIVGSWCGKKFMPEKVAARPGFAAIPAVRDGFLREIKSPLILQPGPAALTDGLDALAGIIAEWANAR